MTRCQTPVPFAANDHERPFYLPTSAHELTPFASPVTERACVDLEALISGRFHHIQHDRAESPVLFYRPTFTSYSPLDGEVTPPVSPKRTVQIQMSSQIVSPNARRVATPLPLPLPLVVEPKNGDTAATRQHSSAIRNKRKFRASTEAHQNEHALPATPLVAGNKKQKTVTAHGSPTTTTTSLESLIQSSLRHALKNRVSHIGHKTTLPTNTTTDELPVSFGRGSAKPVARRVSRSFLSADELLVPGPVASTTVDDDDDDDDDEDLHDFPVVPTRLFVPDLQPLLENRGNYGSKS